MIIFRPFPGPNNLAFVPNQVAGSPPATKTGEREGRQREIAKIGSLRQVYSAMR